MEHDAFARAVRNHDLDAIGHLFAEDAELHSPVAAEPIVGAENVALVFALLKDILQDIVVTTEIDTEDTFVFGFDARIADEPIRILDLLRFDEDGRIRTFVVHSRPLAGTNALAAAICPHRDWFSPRG